MWIYLLKVDLKVKWMSWHAHLFLMSLLPIVQVSVPLLVEVFSIFIHRCKGLMPLQSLTLALSAVSDKDIAQKPKVEKILALMRS